MTPAPFLLVVILGLAPQETSLDFDFYRERVEPIFLEKRDGHARCYTCHWRRTRFRVQKLPPGRSSWTEEESRLNFQAVQLVLTPGDPLESRLLTMPLAEGAGGNPFHPGGKFWESQNDREWRMLAAWVELALAPDEAPVVETSLDFEIYRARVEPIFLKKEAGHARCYVCHRHRTRFRLQVIPEGRTTWTEEESRQNFEMAQRLVVPGEPLRSRLLTMALAEEAGGNAFHPGGKFWESERDPDWQVLADWVRGLTPSQ